MTIIASLLLPYWKREAALRMSFETMRAVGYRDWLEVIVIGDRSEPPDLGEWPFRVQRLTFQDEPIVAGPDKRLNPCKVFNYGAKHARSDVFVLSNPETAHTSSIIPQLVAEVQDNHDAYAMASVLESYKRVKWRQHSKHANWKLHWLTAIHRRMFRRVGGFGDEYRMGLGYEDVDFVRKLTGAGAKFVPRDDLIGIHHCELQGDHDRGVTDNNRAIFESRWGPE